MPSMTLTCRICNLPMQGSGTSAPQGVAAHNACRDSCGSPGRYKRGCRCVECKAGQSARMADYVAGMSPERKAEHLIAVNRRRRGDDWSPVAVNCFVCGEVLRMHSRGGARPMHKTCRANAPLYLKRGTPGPRQNGARSKVTKAAAGTSGNRVFTAGGCRWCSAVFVGVGIYCSKKCSTAAKFARRSPGSAFKISPRNRLAIYERDSWSCQLCFHPVDSSLHYRDNWAASLDHIIPQSKMLVPDHSPSNLRLVHRMCNSMRGDGSNMTESEIHQRIVDHFGVAA